MRELHLPDGKPVVINPQLVAYLYPSGQDATLIGFSGNGTITVKGSYDDVLVDLGLLDDTHPGAQDEAAGSDHDQFDDSPDDDQEEREAEAREEERRLQRDSRLI